MSGFLSSAQQTPPAAPSKHVLVGPHTELVLIDASVLDHRGEYVAGLTKESFRVLDNGVEQPTTFFAPVEAPAQVLVMLETSPAVYLIRDQHLTAAFALVEGLAADDQVALVTYDVTPKTVLSFTADKPALLDALNRTQYNLGMGDLNLYDSVSAVLDGLAPAAGKKELVLLTTGLDSSPPDHWEALAKKLRGEDVVIFSVALGGSLRGAPGKKSKRKKTVQPPQDSEAADEAAAKSNSEAAFAKADVGLRSLAQITGGRAYFPQFDREFATIYREIASALRHQYVLGIVPAHDNQFHKLTVEVDSSGNQAGPARARGAAYRIFARAGYLAPGP